ncbi:hypothetical protein MTR62_20415 [Novosphingobium sp. 1949]|uniref:Response regulatory domain-containing protein n=1 Tax=Novosphingobium organovorum TaxID=2930092 RepID=A0ABT0BJ36_9SPHN|nr:hypothetical protein [Novosphingobium organovorum]MCJ2185029.1 hypothetical protein [Novosphingobium organovorum]
MSRCPRWLRHPRPRRGGAAARRRPALLVCGNGAATTFTGALRSTGYGVRLVHDLDAVREQARAHRFDGVVVDWLRKPVDVTRLPSSAHAAPAGEGGLSVVLHVEDDPDVVRARFRMGLAEERGDLASGVLDPQAARDMVHRMAGLAGTLGAGAVSVAAKRYEQESPAARRWRS